MEQADTNKRFSQSPWTHHTSKTGEKCRQVCATFHWCRICDVYNVLIHLMILQQAKKNNLLEDDTDVKWKVGTRQNEIKLDDLLLVSMHHVSMGSWQPQLRLRRPFSSWRYQSSAPPKLDFVVASITLSPLLSHPLISARVSFKFDKSAAPSFPLSIYSCQL